MADRYGTLILDDGRRFGSIAVSLDVLPNSWSGTFIMPPAVADAFTDFLPGSTCVLRLDDGRVGTIVLWNLTSRTWFQGLGQLAVPTD